MSAFTSLRLDFPPASTALIAGKDALFMDALRALGGEHAREADVSGGTVYRAHGYCTLVALDLLIILAKELAMHTPSAVFIEAEHDGDDVSCWVGHGADEADRAAACAELVDKVRQLPKAEIRRFIAALGITTLPVKVTTEDGQAFVSALRGYGGFGRALAAAWAVADSENRLALYLVFSPIVQPETGHG